jgi:hypothetical protein
LGADNRTFVHINDNADDYAGSWKWDDGINDYVITFALTGGWHITNGGVGSGGAAPGPGVVPDQNGHFHRVASSNTVTLYQGANVVGTAIIDTTTTPHEVDIIFYVEFGSIKVGDEITFDKQP